MMGGTAWTTSKRKKERQETKSSEPLILVTIIGEEAAGKEKMSIDDAMVAEDPPIDRSAPIVDTISTDINMVNTDNAPQAMKKVPFPGRTRVWCGGKLITSAWTSWLWITFLVILIPLIIFFVLVLPEFIATISVFTLIPLFVLMPLSLASSLITAWTDPGILPRNINPTATLRLYGATDYGNDQMISRLVFHDQNPDFLLGKEMIIGDQRVFLKYCTTCQIFRPPRCTHCSYCDNCVEEFDHHCPWVSNCVGRRNYRYFMHFLLFTDLLCLYAFALMAVYIYRRTMGDLFGGWQPGYSFAAAFGIAVYTGLLAIPVTGIFVYHLFITAKHVTTNEQIKMQRAAASGTNTDIVIARNSCPRNYLHTFCLPRPTPVVSWRSYKSSRRSNTS